MEKANGQIENISHLVSVQLFLIFLRIHTSLEPTPLFSDDMSINLRYMMFWFSFVLTLIIFPLALKSVGKDMVSAPSNTHSFMIFFLIVFSEWVVSFKMWVKYVFEVHIKLLIFRLFFELLKIPTILTLMQLLARPLLSYSLYVIRILPLLLWSICVFWRIKCTN